MRRDGSPQHCDLLVIGRRPQRSSRPERSLRSVPSIPVSDELAERLRAATELLEAVVADRSLLAALPLEERTRLLNAAGDVFSPDVEERRRQIKAERRQQKQQKVQRDQSTLDQTGIRSLRARPVFMTPNVFAPQLGEPDAIGESDDVGPSLQAQVHRDSSVLRPDVSRVWRLQPGQAERDRRPTRTGGPANRRQGEDRVPGGYQAAARRGPPHGHHPLSA